MRSCRWGGWLSRKDIARHLDRQRQAALRPASHSRAWYQDRQDGEKRHSLVMSTPGREGVERFVAYEGDWRPPAVAAPRWQPRGTDEWQEVEAPCLPSRIS